MSNPYGGPADWGRAAARPDPFIRWGDTVTIVFAGIANGVFTNRREFQRIQLPFPVVCTLSLAFSVVAVAAGTPAVDWSAIVYSSGLGSSAARTRRVYKGLPQVPNATQPVGTPLDVSFELPVQELFCAIEAQGFDCTLSCTLSLAPVTRVQPGEP